MGQERCNLSERLPEHKRAIRYGQESSVVFNHVSNVGHSINWNNASIVYKSKGSCRRKTVEAAMIQNVANINLS